MRRGRLSILRRAALIPPIIVEELKKIIVPGISELQVAKYIKKRIKQLGGKKPSFRVIVASGHRSVKWHGFASKKKIKKGELVMLDFGVILGGYRSDYTRTFVIGKPNQKQKCMLKEVKIAQTKAIAKVKAGVPCSEVDAAARNYLKKKKLAKYFGHTTGHGIGRKTHEAPKVSGDNNNKLKAGMVITIEPGVYIKGIGGVRIEDMVLVKKNGCEILTRLKQ
ncbi:MAG: M24 family metallopeptidase [Candidatus Margulisbacteria bacterium]|nr:M24 family metallopeptidase [Candidatus Margulisiibacteriota bacterium]MBU1022588.1 M24 family metallopeptidase [Candidatus Margulisiibacteriota bacterium]MBU1728874.1 M24 family metallopeptidase [Candidatus Margulisiibacteriota bacterium]MBU1955505.1 M24 family metallopeptidase [Candidatus Margulisiibacteriota bacterium]